MSKWKYSDKLDTRDYNQEATNMVRPLVEHELYELYGIVIKKLGQAQSIERDKELKAVKLAIENIRGINTHKLNFMVNGYKSDMARMGKPRDGTR